MKKAEADFFREYDQRVMQNNAPELHIIEPQLQADGKNTWLDTTKIPLYDDKGAVNGILVSFEDITEQRAADAEMLRQAGLIKSLLASIPDIVFFKDVNGVYLGCNPLFAKLVDKKSEDEVVGKTDDELFGKDLADFFRHHDNEILKQLSPRQNEEEVTFPDGRKVLVDTLKTPYRDPNGDVIGILGISRDITERKRAEEEREKLQIQLNQAQKMESVGRLAGGVAHDFNNMLGVILGHAELAFQKARNKQDPFSNLEKIQTAAQRSADLTKQLLAFARKQIIEPKILDLNHTVEKMLSMLRRLIGEDIDLSWVPARKLWPVKMDPTQVDQILANLCVNARDAIAGVGKLTIETGMKTFDPAYCADHPGFIPGDFVMLAVSDNGCGMDQEIMENLFEPFFTTKDIGKGTGLGLATIYGIVKQNNGFINVYSEPGQGSTFKIYLRRQYSSAQETASAAHSERSSIPTGNETILLVDD